MQNTGELDTRNMTGLGINAVKIPDGFLCFREVIREEAAAVFLGLSACSIGGGSNPPAPSTPSFEVVPNPNADLKGFRVNHLDIHLSVAFL